jgi:hypothetical protein
MSTKPKPKAPAPAPAPVDSRGNVRVYIDLPPDVARKFNVLAAMRGVAKRVLLAEIVRDAVAEVKL